MPPPPAPTPPYPYPSPFFNAKFWVEIDGIASAFFTECNGLSAETELLEYPEGGLNDYYHKLPGRTKFTNITLKRGWVETDLLWKWYAKTIAGQVVTKAVSIILYENKSQSTAQPKARWDLVSAFPVKWQGPEFRSDSNAVAVETLEIAHSGFQRQ